MRDAQEENDMEAIEFVNENSVASAVLADLIVAFITGVASIFVKRHSVEDEKSDVSASASHGGNSAVIIGDNNMLYQAADDSSCVPMSKKRTRDGLEKIDGVTPISRRLRKITGFLNEGVPEGMDIIRVAKATTNEDGFGKVQAYYNGEVSPPFSFLSSFAGVFGVNQKWLESGIGEAFLVERVDDLGQYMQVIERCNPGAIYFVLNTSERKQAVLVLRTGDYSYITLGANDLPLAIHDSCGGQNVGATGMSNIIDFYCVILFVYERHALRTHDSSINLKQVSSLEITEEEWNALVSGEMYPGVIVNKNVRMKRSFWADDLRDYRQELCGGRVEYEERYGEWFVETQDFIREFIGDDKSSW